MRAKIDGLAAMTSASVDPFARLRFLTGPNDGITNSLILYVHGGRSAVDKGEYLFGVGEGLSRVLLEHKIRPGQHLKATFCSTIAAGDSGGVAGLLHRLRNDGHEQVRPH